MKYIITYEENAISEILIDDSILLSIWECKTILRGLKKFIQSNVVLEFEEENNSDGLTMVTLHFKFNDKIIEIKVFQTDDYMVIQIVLNHSIFSDIIPYPEILKFINIIQ